MMKNYISVNIVSQSLLLVNVICINDCYSIDDIHQLKLPYEVNYEVAMGFINQCGWIEENHGLIKFSETGSIIVDLFNGEYISAELWKVILARYISVCCPAWAKRIPYGRKEAFLFMNEEEQRCFIEAGLIESQSEDVLIWWNELASIERMKSDSMLDDLGRKGERLTMAYEKRRTGIKPDWRSIETNLSGYDILSHRSAENLNSLLIEVKSSSKPINDANAVITRYEWDIVRMRNNLERYVFYLWCIQSKNKQLAVIRADEMLQHIPKDNDSGHWETVSVPFCAFAGKFQVVMDEE